MPAQDRTEAGARGQVWHPVQDNNPAATRSSAGAIVANSIAGCRAVVSHSSDRGSPVFGADWQNLARGSRDKEGRSSDWRARVFATAKGPKCFDADLARDCGISRSKPGCAGRDPEWRPAAGECGDGFEFASGCIVGYSADSNNERSISSCSERLGSTFAASDRRKFFLFCERDGAILKT